MGTNRQREYKDNGSRLFKHLCLFQKMEHRRPKRERLSKEIASRAND